MIMDGEKKFVPGSNPDWNLELPDGDSNSLVTKDGKNWDNGYNFDEIDTEEVTFDDVEFDVDAALAARKMAREQLEGNALDKRNQDKTTTELTKNHEKKLGVEIMNLTPDDNFNQVGEALYLVDQYIFPDLFQDGEKAKIFAKALFSDDPNALFSYSKTLVAKDDENNIVGIMVYRDENCTSWDKEAVKQRFEATGLDLPENFERANDGYMKKITDAELPKGAVEIEFVGVREDYRSFGIGGRLMRTAMDELGYTEAHLDVLDSHPNARKLYDKLGFEPVGEKFGNYPNGIEGVQHMVRRQKMSTPGESQESK